MLRQGGGNKLTLKSSGEVVSSSTTDFFQPDSLELPIQSCSDLLRIYVNMVMYQLPNFMRLPGFRITETFAIAAEECKDVKIKAYQDDGNSGSRGKTIKQTLNKSAI